MKLAVVLLLLAIFTQVLVAKRHSSLKHRFNTHRVSKRVLKKIKAKVEAEHKIPRPLISDVSLLPITPKGEKLDDHFGAEIDASPYGPQPTLIMKDAVSNFNGREEHHILTEVLHTPIGYNDGCDITSFHDFELCLRIQSCDFCTANPHCGWCEATGRCMPGGKEYAVCPTACINGWFFDRQACDGSVTGMFMNVAPEASGFISPELAEPKAYVRTVLEHPVVVHTPVVLGVNHEEHRIDRVNPFSGVTVSHDSYEKTTPITGDLQQVKNVYTQHEQFIDVKTGKKLDNKEIDAYHGYDIESKVI